ncbi:unnamed protein product [Pseudo-nitzschia multistriata]|uniref:Uncharacterized protein n=1 Tax=Pseudo-nitzschia multistriata TaxID=183589 RepID=A0A448Z0Z0_9STRA|nr:unnamed protein product [Pseudo-nitzschia multistriata]
MAPFEDGVEAMTLPENRFDVTIICTTDDHQAEFWMRKLKTPTPIGGAASVFPLVVAVSEDWSGSGGAGNGLGTLYAWEKACAYASEHVEGGPDLRALLAEGSISAALYHTAGKGTRMAPLPASENNNKPGVKLPFPKQITVLEAVVRQTGIYASSRKGRLSVFWGDQVFLPPQKENYLYEPSHHIDIMCTLLGDTAPTAKEWTDQGLDKYGVIAVLKESGDGKVAEAAQVEKVSHETATKMLGELGTIAQVGPSLGSFSVSAAILAGLCEEYSSELTQKQGKMDTDPHFWMPLTLPEDSYVQLMSQKGVDSSTSKVHYQRMKAFSEKFKAANAGSSFGLFGAVDVGKDACWWDYGQLKLYSKNSLLLLDDKNPESKLLRKFLGIKEGPQFGTFAPSDVMNHHSYAFDCNIATGTMRNSLLSHVTAREVNAEGAIIVNCVAPKITAGKGAIIYNIIGEREIVAEEGKVMVAVSSEDGTSMEICSRMDIDGGKVWKEVVEGNPMSFEQVRNNNMDANISQVDLKRKENYTIVTERIFQTMK